MPNTTIPKVLLAGGAAGFAYYSVMRKYWFPDLTTTTGVQNIEARYTAGGGAPTHQPGTATKLGRSSIDDSTIHQTKRQGVDSESFKEKFNEQKSQGVYPAKFYESQYGNSKNK
ncbi:hypothetical protein GQ43DRAFT_383578 [Delitschia confertaspora ATCC 74209]|uniref:Uncharacterized protein n=1 Tax=Delitschia confertaspora ATCC 74209 TaxID=1513339 RepID=A0A9P4JBM0_9PLEO|nr:hypothetical protein GQ43DRAFT_383578 [Delitschia confertaspora ATCC 74209]